MHGCVKHTLFWTALSSLSAFRCSSLIFLASSRSFFLLSCSRFRRIFKITIFVGGKKREREYRFGSAFGGTGVAALRICLRRSLLFLFLLPLPFFFLAFFIRIDW